MENHAPSDELLDLVSQALDHGIGSIEGGGGPLVPFVIEERPGGDRTLRRFVADHLEDAVAAARDDLRSLEGAARAALAWDGYVTMDGERTDAVLVEGHEQGVSTGLIFAQRYRPGGRLRRFQTIGDAALVGACDALWP